MLVNIFLYILVFSVISFALCLVGTGITYLFQGPELAEKLFTSYVFHFNGILIFGTGYGLVWFVKNNGRNVLAQLFNILDIPENNLIKINASYSKTTSVLWINVIAIPVTVAGSTILWKCGYPLSGFGKYFLAASSMSLYYAGGCLLAFFIYSIGLFRSLEESYKKVSKMRGVSQIEFETLNHFFILTSTIGVFGLYLAFRGTLTANFTSVPTSFLGGKLLVFPLIIFLPAPLLYSFYPRYVLKRIFDYDVLKRIAAIEENRYSFEKENASYKDRLEMEKILLEIKDRLVVEMNSLSIFSIKDSPSLLISILMVIQFIVPKDGVVMQFFESLFQ